MSLQNGVLLMEDIAQLTRRTAGSETVSGNAVQLTARKRARSSQDCPFPPNRAKRCVGTGQACIQPCGAEALAGLVFICNLNTFNECLSRRLLGLPQKDWSLVQKLKRGMFVFLYNYGGRQLHGIYRASGDGALNLDTTAWSRPGGGSRFPAQLQFEIHRVCKPLEYVQFSKIVTTTTTEQGGVRIQKELSGKQVQLLKQAFQHQAVLADPSLEELPPHLNHEWRQSPYNAHHRTLILGDGNFSFSASLAVAFQRQGILACNLTCTSLDSLAELRRKYGAEPMERVLHLLQRLGARCCHGVDCRQWLDPVMPRAYDSPSGVQFDRIVMNFPHARSEKEPDERQEHQTLLKHFFVVCSSALMSDGEVHLSLVGKQSVRWRMVEAARAAGFQLYSSHPFKKELYPQYQNVSELGSHVRFPLTPTLTLTLSLARI